MVDLFESPEKGDTRSGNPPSRRVYVIDDDPAVLDTVQRMLEQAGFDARPYQSSTRFIEEIRQLEPGVVITDQVMDDVVGTEVQRNLSLRPNDFRVILVTAFPRTSLAVTAMKCGAVTVLDKPFERRELLEAVEEGFRQLLDAESLDQALPPLLPSGETYLDRLSERELEVVKLVYDGHTNKSIGIELGISVKTVEKHRGNAMKKLRVHSLASLIRLMDREMGRS